MNDVVIGESRSLKYAKRQHNRYWWYKLSASNYIPPVLQRLSHEEWSVLDEWFTDTELHFGSPGELGVPGISFLEGLIGGNGIDAVVQCGHYVGFSSLMLGFIMRSMGKKHSVYSIDLDPTVTEYTQRWIERAGLTEYVQLAVNDSADLSNPDSARLWLQKDPQIVFIDSSHMYSHTLLELNLWYQHVQPGGFILMHDTSVFAEQFDSSKLGGVRKAANEWAAANPVPMILLNQFVNGTRSPNELVYKDGCGFGIIQKPADG